MITGKVNQVNKTIELQYPNFAKERRVVVSVRSYDDAATVLRIRRLKFIAGELRSFIKMRLYAYTKGDSLTPERERALKKLRFIVDSYSEGSLLRLAKHVAGSQISFSVLMPIKPSPAKTHFDNHIVPIIKYCVELFEQDRMR